MTDPTPLSARPAPLPSRPAPASSGATPVAIVTGASSGIGKETALALARRGYTVVLAARRQDRLRAAADLCLHAGARPAVAFVTDVAVAGQVRDLVASTVERFGRLDVMVNNAGSGLVARVHELDDSQLHRLFEVNFFGIFHGCREAAPVMMRQRSGHIFNVSSVIGRRGMPFHGAYCATKSAICGLTDSLRVEMMPYNVRVTCVMPARTDTEFIDASLGPRRPASRFQKTYGIMSPAVVARKIAATAGKSKPELVFSLGGKFLILLSVLWPALADRLMKAYHDDLLRKMRGTP